MMETLNPNEKFSNHGVSFDVLNADVKFFDELIDAKKTVELYGHKKLTEENKSYLETQPNLLRIFNNKKYVKFQMPCKIHQLPHMHDMAQTALDIKENFFGTKNNFCLKEGYIIAVSDIHGDFMVFLGNLILSGVCTVDPENFILIDIDTSEIYDTEEKIVDAIQKLNNDKLIHEDSNEHKEKNRLIYLPKITLNQNFKGTINFLGDYIDRGSEDLQCLALILYLTKLNENLNLKINFLLGNHEVAGICGQPTNFYFYQHIISKMIENNILKICMFEEIENGQLLVFEHTLVTKRNLSAMVALLIILLDKNFELNENDIEALWNKDYYSDKTSFINEFKENVIKCRELFEIELKKDSVLENKTNNLVNNFFIATPEGFDTLFAKLSTKDEYLNSIKKVLEFNRYIGFKDELYKLLEIDNLDFSDSNEDKWNQLCDKLISNKYWTKFKKKLGSKNYNNLLDTFNKSIENWDLIWTELKNWSSLNFERLMSDKCKELFKQKLESNDYKKLREDIYSILEMIEQKKDMDTLCEILEAKTPELQKLRSSFFEKFQYAYAAINRFNELLKELNNELNLNALHETLNSVEKRKTFLKKIKSEEDFQNHFIELLDDLNEQNQFEMLCTTLKSDETRKGFCEKLCSLNENFSKELKEFFRDLYLHGDNCEILYETLISKACGFSVKNFFEIKDKVTKNTLVLYNGTLGGFYKEENFWQKALYAEYGKLDEKYQLGWPLAERPSYNTEDLFEKVIQIHCHTRDKYNKININKPKDINGENINLDLMASVGYNYDKSIIALFFFAPNGKYGVIKYIAHREKNLDDNMQNILKTNDDGKKFILSESENTIQYYENGNIIQYKNDLEENQNELSVEQIKREMNLSTSEKNKNDTLEENNDGINAINVADKVEKPKENSKEDKDKTDESSNENNDNDNHNSDSDSGSFDDSDDGDKSKKIKIEPQNLNNGDETNVAETEYASSSEDGSQEIDGGYPDSNDNNKVDLNSILPENFKTDFKIDNAENYYSEIKILIEESIPETEDKRNLLATINNLDNNPKMKLGRKIKEVIRLLPIVIELIYDEYLAKSKEGKNYFIKLPIKDQLTTLRVYRNSLSDKFTDENLDKIETFTDKDAELFEMELETILKDKIHLFKNVLPEFDKLNKIHTIKTIKRLKLKIKMTREISSVTYNNFLIDEGFTRRQRNHYADEFSKLSWLEQINICETVMKKQESDKTLRDENMSLFERWVNTKNPTEKEKNNATKSFEKLSVKDQMFCLQKLDVPPIEQSDVPPEI